MTIHISLLIAESMKRGRGFAAAVQQAGLKNRGGLMEIGDREWLILCDKWPDDPAAKAIAGPSLEPPACC